MAEKDLDYYLNLDWTLVEGVDTDFDGNSYHFVEIKEIPSFLFCAKTAEKADTKEITKDLLNKMSSKNLKMNALNWGAGFVTSALFLSTLIPKMQYMITKWRTGSDAFPGTAQYRDEAKKSA